MKRIVELSIRFIDIQHGDLPGLLKDLEDLAAKHKIDLAPERNRILKQLPMRITRSREDLLSVMEETASPAGAWDVLAAAEKLHITKAQMYSLLADKGISVRKQG